MHHFNIVFHWLIFTGIFFLLTGLVTLNILVIAPLVSTLILLFFFSIYIYRLQNYNLKGKIIADQKYYFEDTPIELNLEIKNEGAPISNVEFYGLLPENRILLEKSSVSYHNFDKNETRIINFNFKLPEAGKYQIGPIRIRKHDPLGLSYEESLLPVKEILSIVPKTERLKKFEYFGNPTKNVVGSVASKQTITRGWEFYALKEYTSGDPMKSINWKATARLDEVISNQYIYELSSDVVIILDVRNYGLAYETTRRLLKLQICTAILLAEQILNRKDRVGILIYHRTLDKITLGSGRKHLIKIIDKLISISVAEVSYNIEYISSLFRRFYPPNTKIIFISPLLDNPSINAVRKLIYDGYSMLIISPSFLPIEYSFIPHNYYTELAYKYAQIERECKLKEIAQYAPLIDWNPDYSLEMLLWRNRKWLRKF